MSLSLMKILIVGYGSIGKRHVKNLLKLSNIEILICSKQNIKQNSKFKILHSLDQCIKEKPNAAIIANVSSQHISIALKLANAGIHLFVEKPLSNSLLGIKKLETLVKKKKLITQMGCNLRFHECLQKIKQMLSNNEIGRVISANIESGSYLPDWHPYEDYRKSYASNKNLGGGVVFTCIHEIDYLYWFFGNAKEIFSITGKYSDLDISVDDLSVNLLKFSPNIVVQLHLNYFQKPEFRCCKIIGTNGIIYWDSKSNTVKKFSNKNKSWKNEIKIKNYNRNNMYEQELMHFINCIEKQKQSINPLSDGIKTLKIALAIHKSSKIKRMCIP